MRTFSKTATWSIIAFLVTMIIGWILTGDPIKGGWIACLCRAIKIPAYYYHERVYRKHWPTEATPAIVETTQGWQEDYELESRRTVAHQAPSYVQHCNAG